MKKRYQEKKIITDNILKRIERTNPSLASKIKTALKENKRVYYKEVLVKHSSRRTKGPCPPKRVIKVVFPAISSIDDGYIPRDPLKK